MPNHFDYIIIGSGMAGFQLAMALANDAFFSQKTIALIDKDEKNTNDKTWCFWEKPQGKWDAIVIKTWEHTNFITSEKVLNLNLSPYHYKKINAIDFYNFCKDELKKHPNFTFIKDEILSTSETSSKVEVTSKINTYSANHVFDSRIPEQFFSSKNHITLHQHFKGWVIETETNTFDDTIFTMMDYRLKHNNDTTFTYVLPLSKQKALIEFTFFTPYTIENSEYDGYLKDYITSVLNIKNYTILEEESGNIPMSNFKFKAFNTSKITKIGTAGGWVKPSTGYAFKHTENKVNTIVNNLKTGENPSQNLFKSKYEFYDNIFLNVLYNENTKGEWIFNQFYSKNSIKTMFQFLDEESTFGQDVSIMKSLFSFSFIKAFFKTLF